MIDPNDPKQCHRIRPIARVISPFKEKFGTPRQPGLVDATGHLLMLPGFDLPDAFEGLADFSHIWVVFGFDQCADQWKLRVRPPRLGGNREMGVFATRSPFRPNNLGLSVLRLEGMDFDFGQARLTVRGLDLVDGTPVFDIKPYLAYCDAIPGAASGFADAPPAPSLEVVFSDTALSRLNEQPNGKDLRLLIEQTLALDPRPAYRRGDEGRRYGTRLQDWDVRWQVEGGRVWVLELTR